MDAASVLLYSKINSFSWITWECQVDRNNCHFVHLFKNGQIKREKGMQANCLVVTKWQLKITFTRFYKNTHTHKFISIFTFQMNIFRFVRNYTRETTRMSTNWSLRCILGVLKSVALTLSLCLCLCQFNLAYCLLSLFYYSSSQVEFVEFLQTVWFSCILIREMNFYTAKKRGDILQSYSKQQNGRRYTDKIAYLFIALKLK